MHDFYVTKGKQSVERSIIYPEGQVPFISEA